MNKYEITYQNHTWVVVDTATNKGIVCFPSQVMASKWITDNTTINA